MKTTCEALQKKLDGLVALAAAGDREAFARAFVPLDLTEDELAGYVGHLKNGDGEWKNLISEIKAVALGETVERIEGDQITRATFFFPHPTIELCDREVVFVRPSKDSDWRAEG